MAADIAPARDIVGDNDDVEVETQKPLPLHVNWVRNESAHGFRGIYHVPSRRLSGVQMHEWKSRCGWRFGGIPTVAIDVAPPTIVDWERVCKRCARDRQEELELEHNLTLKSER